MLGQIHGHKIIGAVEVFLGRNEQAAHVAILVDRGEGTYERYVTALCALPEDGVWPESWFWGHYHGSLEAAQSDFMIRAEMPVLEGSK